MTGEFCKAPPCRSGGEKRTLSCEFGRRVQGRGSAWDRIVSRTISPGLTFDLGYGSPSVCLGSNSVSADHSQDFLLQTKPLQRHAREARKSAGREKGRFHSLCREAWAVVAQRTDAGLAADLPGLGRSPVSGALSGACQPLICLRNFRWGNDHVGWLWQSQRLLSPDQLIQKAFSLWSFLPVARFWRAHANKQKTVTPKERHLKRGTGRWVLFYLNRWCNSFNCEDSKGLSSSCTSVFQDFLPFMSTQFAKDLKRKEFRI